MEFIEYIYIYMAEVRGKGTLEKKKKKKSYTGVFILYSFTTVGVIILRKE